MRIREICTSITDGSHNPPQGVEQSEYLMLSSKNIFDDAITLDDPRFLGKEDFVQEDKRTRIIPGDVLLTIVGTVGRCAVVPECFPRFTLQRSVAVLHPKMDVCSSRFLMYALRGKRYYIEKRAKGVAQKGIYLGEVADIEVDIPTIDKQVSIIKRLDSVDSIIKKRHLELDALDDLIKARFVEMFGEPIANPMNWPIKRLDELSTLITNGNTPKGGSENYVENGITFLRSQNVWRNRIELDDVAYIDEATHKSMWKSSLHHKDILITKTGRINTENSSLGRAALFLGADNSANINGHVYLVRLNGSIVPEFVVTILTGEAYRRYIRKVCVGGIDKRQINVDQVEDFPIIIPPYEQQLQFATFVAQIDKSKFALMRMLHQISISQRQEWTI